MNPPARVVLAAVVDTPIDVAATVALVGDDRAGAIVSFTGVVRDHDRGRSVIAIEYQAHPSASAVIAEVAREAAGLDDVHAIAVVHRIGTLAVGDTALVAAVSAAHRGQAFATASALVEGVKGRLPVWKLQRFADGSTEWTGCP